MEKEELFIEVKQYFGKIKRLVITGGEICEQKHFLVSKWKMYNFMYVDETKINLFSLSLTH